MRRNFQGARKAFLPARQPTSPRTGSRSLRVSENRRKPLMLLVLPALPAARHCPLNRDSNDNAYPSAQRIESPSACNAIIAGDFAAFPVIPPEVVAAPPKPTYYPWGSLANSDIYANYATSFRAQERPARRLPGTMDFG
jgi:hypothetical protein